MLRLTRQIGSLLDLYLENSDNRVRHLILPDQIFSHVYVG